MAALKRDKTPAELAEKFDLHANQSVQRKKHLLDAATSVFPVPAEKHVRESSPGRTGAAFSLERGQSSVGQPVARQPVNRSSSCGMLVKQKLHFRHLLVAWFHWFHSHRRCGQGRPIHPKFVVR